MTPEWFNEKIELYWREAENAGVKLARVPQELALADPNHRWGPAYFHYEPVTYKAQLEAIGAAI